MDELVITTLQEGGVNRHHGLETLTGQTCGESDRVLFGNAHVKVAARKTLVKFDHARAFSHGGGDGHQTRVSLGHVAQPLAKNMHEAGLAGCAFGEALSGVELGRGRVVLHGVGLGELVAIALFGDHMQELRAALATQVFQGGNQRFQVMAIDRANVIKTKFFKDGAGHDHAFGMPFKTLGQLKQRWRHFEHLLGTFACCGVKIAAHQAGQVFVQGAHGRADRHVVVVEHHQHIAVHTVVRHTGVVHGLEGHASTHGTVTNDGHGFAFFALDLGRQRHAQRGRNRRG